MKPTVTAQNQVTLPKAIRDYLGVSPGERVTFEPLPDGRAARTGTNRDSGGQPCADRPDSE